MEEYRGILALEPADPSALPMVLANFRRAGEVDRVVDLAERALESMPDNFFALDGLAWARIEQHRHSEAKAALERAVASLDDLKVEKPFGWSLRLSLGIARLVTSVPGIRGHVSRIPSAVALGAAASRDLAEWRSWANEYLAWYAGEFGSGP